MAIHTKIKPAQLLVPITRGASGGQMTYWDSTAGVWTTIGLGEMSWDDANSKLVLGSGTGINEFSIDGTLSGESDDVVPTEKAVKTYVDAHAGGGSPGGSNTQIQYNDSGSFGGEANFTYDETTKDVVLYAEEDNAWLKILSYSSVGANRGLLVLGGADGTEASPGAIENDDGLGSVMFAGYNGSAWKYGANLSAWADEDWDGSNNGTFMRVELIANGETSTHTALEIYGSSGMKLFDPLTLNSGTNISEFSIDGTLSGESDDAVPTEKAVKTYVDAQSGGSPGGADSYVQYNNGGSFGGDSAFHWDDTNKFLAIGTHTPLKALHIEGASGDTSTITVSRTSNDEHQPYLQFKKVRGSSTVQVNDILGDIISYGHDGISYRPAASVRFICDAATDTDTVPGRIEFRTTTDSTATTPTIKLTLDNEGMLSFPTGTDINEFSTDGTLSGESDDVVPTEKAVKTYVDNNSGGTPGGNDTEIQFNDSGSFGASSSLTFDGTNLSLASGTGVNEFSTDGLLVGNSDNAIPTEKAVKTYIDNAIVSHYIDQSGIGNDTYGVLSGSLDGTNTTFIVSEEVYETGSLRVFLNGQLQAQGTSGNGDWTETTPSSGIFDFVTPPSSSDDITAMYGVASMGPRIITTPVQLDVPSDFATIQAAMDWIEERVILAQVIIQLADGTYNMGAGVSHTFAHPNYSFVKIIGNATTPSNVLLNFSTGTNAFYVYGCTLDTIKGVKIDGAANGIYLNGAKVLNINDIIMDNIEGLGLTCSGSIAHSVTGVELDNCGNIGMIVVNNSTALGSNINSHDNTNHGFYCTSCSLLAITNPTSVDNGQYGFLVRSGGTVRTLGSVTVTGNGTNYSHTLNSADSYNSLITTQ